MQRALEERARGLDIPVVVAGVDSYLDAHTLDWLESQRLLAMPGGH
ncbi:MAG: hypothetical protein R6X02_35945 [Enhygromyxa sp.]